MIILILMMLIIIPLLTVNDPDISLSLGVQFVHSLGIQNSTDPATYSVCRIQLNCRCSSEITVCFVHYLL